MTEVIAGEDGKARAVKVRNLNDGTSQEIPPAKAYLLPSDMPNTHAQPFQGILTLDENGYFVAQDKSMVKTNQDGVYVAGDCADHVYRQAITAAGMGCQAAIEAERWLADQG